MICGFTVVTAGWTGLGENIRGEKSPNEQIPNPDTGRSHKFPSMRLQMVQPRSPIEIPLFTPVPATIVTFRQILSRHFLANMQYFLRFRNFLRLGGLTTGARANP
jgi:hypothetical protein